MCFRCTETLAGGCPRTPARCPHAMARPWRAEAKGMDGLTHQIRQRQARGERVGVPIAP